MKKISLLFLLLFHFHGLSAQNAKLIPWPKTIIENTGFLTISDNSKIVFTDVSLQPLANILKKDIQKLTGLDLTITSGNSNSGDIELALNDNLGNEEYTLEVANKIIIKGKDYRASVWGTSTLLQILKNNGEVKRMAITDSPDTDYRGLMVDLARKWHEVENIKNIIDMCRFYKVNFLQLHLTDDQSFTFPSTAYPNLATPGRSYTLSQLNELEKYSQERGITIVPELDVPGHAKKMVEAYPNIFGIPGMNGNVINFSSTDTWDAVGTLVDEIAKVFKTTPYMHIGGDEVIFSGLGNRQDFRDAVNTYNVGNVQGLFNYFLNQINDDVRRNGKKTIVWEGFSPNRNGNAKVNSNVIVSEWVNKISADAYASNGHDVINNSWVPLYLIPSTYVPPVKIYNWNKRIFGRYASNNPFSHNNVLRFTMNRTNKLIGAQTCSWEQAAEFEISSLRNRLCVMSDRIWNENSGKPFSDFTSRFESTDVILQIILATDVPDRITPNASFGIYNDKISVRWREGSQYPDSYTLYRNTINNSSTATAILSNTKTFSYDDVSINSGQNYYYWVKANNSLGTSSFGNSDEGKTGNRKLSKIYEPFNYNTNANLNNLNGGEGFNGRWNVINNNGRPSIDNIGLNYPNLITNGKSLKIRMNGANSSFAAERRLEGFLCPEGAEVWASALFKANKVANGGVFVSVGNEFFGKGWINGIIFGDNNSINAQVAIENGETVLVVIKVECYTGKDNVHIWANPIVDGKEPDINDGYFTSREDLGNNPKIKLSVAPSGEGEYNFDELRVGTSFKDVMPAKNILDTDDVSLNHETVRIYPNPFNSELFIDQTKDIYQEAIVYDLSGRIIRKTEIDNQKNLVISKATQISSGVYILKLIGKNRTKSIKIIRN